MRFGSVCSGIEAASVAWEPLGWRPAWFAEIDPFPSAVLAHHYPETPNLGDFTKIQQSEPIDILVGGTPCQSFSIAGLRGGLDDDRGNLALEFLRLAGRLRPRWLVWENVPGVLSSSGGRDFGAFLGGLAELGYGWSYRVLDAQFVRVDGFGRAVPQRRRRVFVVGHIGDWRRAVAVLFDRESLRKNDPPKRLEKSALPAFVVKGASLGREPKNGPRADVLSNGSCYTLSCEEVHVVAICDPSHPRIRFLTPRECERLMGFPDDYTLVPYRGKPAKDGPRYKAIGNSMAVNVMRWIGRRIEMAEAIHVRANLA